MGSQITEEDDNEQLGYTLDIAVAPSTPIPLTQGRRTEQPSQTSDRHGGFGGIVRLPPPPQYTGESDIIRTLLDAAEEVAMDMQAWKALDQATLESLAKQQHVLRTSAAACHDALDPESGISHILAPAKGVVNLAAQVQIARGHNHIGTEQVACASPPLDAATISITIRDVSTAVRAVVAQAVNSCGILANEVEVLETASERLFLETQIAAKFSIPGC